MGVCIMLAIAIPDPDKREYYQFEAVNECWTKHNRSLSSQTTGTRCPIFGQRVPKGCS